ncbi:MAG: hypothetical protein AAF417_21870 [Pseudomonadota bacterium]
MFRAVLVRTLPVVLVTMAAMLYVVHVEGGSAYPVRNCVPMMLALALSVVVVYRGGGSWFGRGATWPLAIVGYSIPAIGLSIYLHYGYTTDLHGMFSEAVYPEELFRYLPIYTVLAGLIGFAIGWIVGRNVDGDMTGDKR